MQYKNAIRYSLVVIANLVLFYFLYRWYQNNIHWHEFVGAFRLVPRSAIILAFVLGILILGLYSLRLKNLLDQRTKGSFWTSFWVISFGFGANNILPFRLGDALKIYFAKKNFDISVTQLLLVKVMEKFFDLSSLLIIGGLVVVLGSIAIQKIHLLIICGALLAIFCAVLAALIFVRRDIALVKNLRHYERINHIITMFETVLTNPNVKKALGVTACIWVMSIGVMYMYYTLVLPNIDLQLVDILALVFITSLSLGVPSVPGALGVFEAAIVFYLSNFLNVPAAEALAYALTLHMVQAGPQIILMFMAMLAAKLRQKNH